MMYDNAHDVRQDATGISCPATNKLSYIVVRQEGPLLNFVNLSYIVVRHTT